MSNAVLLVDDEPANIQLLYDILKQDFELFYATNGPDALQWAAEKQPDLILEIPKMRVPRPMVTSSAWGPSSGWASRPTSAAAWTSAIGGSPSRSRGRLWKQP